MSGRLHPVTTDVDLGLLALRVLVGVVFSLHGMQKMFGWFGGRGLEATAGGFGALGFGDGKIAARLAATGEMAGGLGLALGLLTPLASMAAIGVMTVAALLNRSQRGFWAAGNGWEINYYIICVAFALAITGPGAYSLDAVLGLGWLSGPISALLGLAVGVGLGFLRWTTRNAPATSEK
jgi:putative oxidoreductase